MYIYIKLHRVDFYIGGVKYQTGKGEFERKENRKLKLHYLLIHNYCRATKLKIQNIIPDFVSKFCLLSITY